MSKTFNFTQNGIKVHNIIKTIFTHMIHNSHSYNYLFFAIQCENSNFYCVKDYAIRISIHETCGVRNSGTTSISMSAIQPRNVDYCTRINIKGNIIATSRK